jgi:DNA-binding transcriptional LysR family regulator
MSRLESMQIFVRVAELGSFTRAAEAMGLQKASASMAIRRLEDHLGTRLLHRTTRKVQLTQDGRAFYERCKDLLAHVDDVQSMFQSRSQSLRGRLRVDMPSGIAQDQVIPKLRGFLRDHPLVEIEVGSTDRKVDVIREGFDCVLRVGAVEDPNLIARSLGRFRLLNCVSPGYIAERGVPRTLDDLQSHLLVHYVTTLGGKSPGFEYFDGTKYRTVAMDGPLTVSSAGAYQAGCLAGLGIIQAPAVGLQPLIDQGKLVEVLPELRAEPMPVAFVYAHRRNVSRRVQVFMAWVGEILAPYLEQSP